MEAPVEDGVDDAVVDALLDPVRVCSGDAEEVVADATVLLFGTNTLVLTVDVRVVVGNEAPLSNSVRLSRAVGENMIGLPALA